MIVFQYAPWFVYGEASFDHLQRCAERLRDDLIAVEFRNQSWFNDRCRENTLDAAQFCVTLSLVG